ncbi:MAG: sigma-70 family RNA polymerase sigma factor [Spirochaetes bacterium]|nr:MAG: sigma-70 family RNA polymerase sigma factor [Spirochaetota bacterium]
MNNMKSHPGIAEFFKSEYAAMVAFVRRRIDDAADRDVEDVVQDVMMHIFDAADVTRPIENLSAYVYRSLRNRVIDLLRGRRNDVSLDASGGGEGSVSLADVLYDARYDTAAEFERHEVLDRVFEIIDDLGEDEKALIILTEFGGRSFRDLAEEWGEPVGTLLSRKSRALAKIRKRLFDEYWDEEED